jgi:hypothetical protein
LLSDAQGGNEPERTLKVGAGVPVAVTWKVPAVDSVKPVEAALVNTGGWVTVSVAAAEVAAAPTPFVATALNWSLFIAVVRPLTVRVVEVTPL